MLTEFHITVEASDISKWIRDCKKISAKPLGIQLDRGKHQLQLMASRVVELYPEMVDNYRERFANQIIDIGYSLLRQKVEVPISAAKEQKVFGVEYYETHFKFLAPQKDWEYLIYCSESDKMPLSYNLLAGAWYATTRSKYKGYRYVNEVPCWLNKYETKFHSEAVLIDSNPALDSGWLSC